MASVLHRITEKITHSPAPSSGSSPAGSRPRKSSKTSPRAIPPEPIQQHADGELTSAEAGPAIQVHNLARANKMVPKIEWSERLAQDAEKHARQLAEIGRLERSACEVQGENLFVSEKEDVKFDEAVEAWLGEEKKYGKEKIGDGNLEEYGNFTQCLWSSTRYVGMGKAIGKDGKTYIVGRYTPKGNTEGGLPF